MSAETTPPQIPTIDFSGLDLSSSPGSKKWESVRSQIMEAIETHGFFHAVLDPEKLSPAGLDDFIGPPLEEMFSVPKETKMKMVRDNHYEGYMGWFSTFELMVINDPTETQALDDFANVIWPQQGNPSFCEKVVGISKPLAEIDLMVRKMILEALNVGKHFESHVEPTRQVIRLVRYEAPDDQESRINMPEHTDMNVLSIVYQHGEQGLELQTLGGQWLQAPLNSFTIFAGETLMAMTNGRLKPAVHRVKMPKNDIRYSIGFSSHYKDGYMIEVLEELVDEEHPKLFNPYEYPRYMKFRLTEAGKKAECALTAYCGVKAEDVAAA